MAKKIHFIVVEIELLEEENTSPETIKDRIYSYLRKSLKDESLDYNHVSTYDPETKPTGGKN